MMSIEFFSTLVVTHGVSIIASAQVECYFSNLKRNQGLKQHISHFIKNRFEELQWQQRRFFDGIIQGHADSTITCKLPAREFQHLTNIAKGRTLDESKPVAIIEDRWNKGKKSNIEDSKKLGFYRSTRNKKNPFSAKKEKEDESVRQKKAFNVYLLSQWKKSY